MIILGLILGVFGAVLLVTAKDDVLASTPGIAFIILGSVWAGFYYAMLTGW